MKKYFVFLLFLQFWIETIAQTPDPIPPAEPAISQFVNLGTASNKVYASQFGTNPIKDGTGGADPGSFVMDQRHIYIGTHLYSGQGSPFAHAPGSIPAVQDTVTLEGFINGNVFTTPSPLFIFGNGGVVNFQSFIIDQSLGGTTEPIFLKNTDITIPTLGIYDPPPYINFINGKMYAVGDEKIILSSRKAYTQGGSSSSYFDGTMQKWGAICSCAPFVFVVGDQNIYAPLTVTGSNDNADGTPSSTTVRYYALNPGNTNNVTGDLASVSVKEYYSFNSNRLTDIAMEINHFTYGASDPSKLTIAGWDGTVWKNLQSFGGAGVVSGNTVKVTLPCDYCLPNPFHLSNYSKITLAITRSTLPIKWKSFNASQKDGKGLLNWTAETIDVKSFTVESSCDGISFHSIGTLPANPGNTYSFTDSLPCGKIVYYRIASNDFDGKKTYSQIRAVNFTRDHSFKVWPNPAKDWLNISIPSGSNKTKAELFNSNGNILINQEISILPGETHQIDVSSLPSGIYHLRVVNNSITHSENIIRQ